jgi:hypothetical protein
MNLLNMEDLYSQNETNMAPLCDDGKHRMPVLNTADVAKRGGKVILEIS